MYTGLDFLANGPFRLQAASNMFNLTLLSTANNIYMYNERTISCIIST